MIDAAGLLLLLALNAPGDLIRCIGADGVARWQDRPCARGERSDRLGGAAATQDPEALRRRIEALREHAPPPRARAGARAAGAARPAIAIGEAALAACSERFLACADHDRARMDACVATIPRCPGGGGACCPPACTESYARERRAGATPPDAVYLALLAPDAGGCGGAGP
jgi:hypothetical protein